jgi:hypothetical protein
MIFVEGRETRDQPVVRRRRTRTHRNNGARGRQPLRRFLQSGERALRGCQQIAALRRERGAHGASHEKRHAEVALEQFDAMAGRALRDAQLLGGAREAL